MKFESKFTTQFLDHGGSDYDPNLRSKCSCVWCSNPVTNNPMCSDQCGGFTEKSPQDYGMYGVGPLQSDSPKSCYHEHSRCFFPGCKHQSRYIRIKQNNRDIRLFPQPFCDIHTPRCKCVMNSDGVGLKYRYTLKKYSHDTTQLLNGTDVKEVQMKYQPTCLDKHHRDIDLAKSNLDSNSEDLTI